LIHNNVRTLAEDKTGKIWIATDGGGISVFNPKTNSFTHYQQDSNDKNSLSGNHVPSILLDKDSICGLGLGEEGLVF
jgi:ligand-binding sensor domain-containing protein